LRETLVNLFGIGDFEGYFLISRAGVSLASFNSANTGTRNYLNDIPGFVDRAWGGQTVMSPLIKNDIPIQMASGETCPHRWNFFLATPVRDSEGQILAVMTTRHNPGHSLLPLLAAQESSAQAQTYLVDSNGRMISPSRFQGGTLSNKSCEATLPFVNLTGGTSDFDIDEPSEAVREVLAQFDGASVEAYSNHEGQEVVGIWRYSDETRLGVVTEKNYATFRAQQASIAYRASGVGAGVAILLTIAMMVIYRNLQGIAARSEAGWLFDAMLRGVFFLDDHGRFVRVNDTFCQQTGHSAQDLLGKPIWTIDSRLRETFENARKLRLNDPGLREATMTVGFRDDQSEERFYFFAIASLIQVANGLFGGVCADVTEIDRDQRAWAAANAQAEATARARNAFLELASHEMRTPLTTVVSGLSLLKIDPTDTESSRFLNMVKGGAQDLLKAVDSMETYVALASGKDRLNIAPFELRLALEDAIAMANETHGDHIGVAVVETGSPDCIVSDRSVVASIVSELILNAVVHADNDNTKPAQVVIEGQKLSNDTGDEIEICVVDNGKGLEEGNVEKAFQVFSRLDTENTSQTRGLGIGLPIAVERARSLGGTLTYRPNPKGGSIFALRLPLNMAAG
jgi:PAS domain S-box-containing protein